MFLGGNAGAKYPVKIFFCVLLQSHLYHIKPTAATENHKHSVKYKSTLT